MLTRDALRLGNISFSNEFFCTTQTVKLVKQQLEDELVCAAMMSRGVPLTV